MSELIDRQAAIEELKSYIIDPKKAISENPDDVFQYNAGIRTAVGVIMELPAASPWHMVEDDAELLSLIISEICSYSVKNEMEPDDSLRTVAQNILKLLKISTFNNWMPIEPPKEEEHGN